MRDAIKLNSNNLKNITAKVQIPGYNRNEIKAGIAHIGVGNFHRAHEAFYTDQIFSAGAMDWGICGICLLEIDRKMYNTLVNQDGLYTLMIKEPRDVLIVRIIGSIVEYMYAPEKPEKVIKKLADPSTRIISLTITEGGYNYDEHSLTFRYEDPAIQWDLAHPENPKTVYGYLTRSLKHRKDHRISGLTILSCDNIQHNGDVCKKMLLSFIDKAEPGLTDWVEKNLSFPNCMVDRITPSTSLSDCELLRDQFGIEDAWPVVCEPFIQWIIEDNFRQSRPDWEKEGVQFVKKVDPYEKMKIRLLNAGHSLLGFSGSLFGYQTVEETVKDPLFRAFLQGFMDKEVTPLLGKIEGISLDQYKHELIRRFSNPNINDLLSRICSESSSKIPKFLIPTIREQLKRGGPIQYGTLILASWCRYLELAGAPGYPYEVQDVLSRELRRRAIESSQNDPLAFIKIDSVFGDLSQSRIFTENYIKAIENLRNYRIDVAIRQLIDL